jgi:hypothetical protein
MEGAKMSESERVERQDEIQAKDKKLSPEAQRALAEAEERRRRTEGLVAMPAEFNGPKGPEPIRYGDWERKGIASDF